MIAQYIHLNSRRNARDLVPVNCAAIPEALLESEMFGHVEGAFTGAVRDKEGLLEVANGGTLFLDELTELPLPTQAKLLRVLQDGVVRRVGSTKTDAVVNIRFIAATNRDPMEAIAEGVLRKDLHYRLRVVPIHIRHCASARKTSRFWQTSSCGNSGSCIGARHARSRPSRRPRRWTGFGPRLGRGTCVSSATWSSTSW